MKGFFSTCSLKDLRIKAHKRVYALKPMKRVLHKRPRFVTRMSHVEAKSIRIDLSIRGVTTKGTHKKYKCRYEPTKYLITRVNV